MCATGTISPASLVVFTVLANGKPVFSSIGNASSSVRNITIGPAPFFRIATTPVPPTPVVTSYPNALTRAASVAAVRCS